MSKAQDLYDKFVDVLIDKLKCEEPTAKDLDVILKFVQYEDLHADKSKHKGLKDLEANLPFEEESELPAIRRVK